MKFTDIFANLFKKSDIIQIKSDALLNEPMAYADYSPRNTINYEQLWNWFRKTPEIVAITNCIVEDVMSDGGYFEGSPEDVAKAQDFMERTQLKSKLMSWMFDDLVTGDAYLLKKKITEGQVKDIVDKSLQNSGFENKSDVATQLFFELKSEKALFATREVQVVPSSTVTIKADEYGTPIEFTQKVNTVSGPKSISFSPDEIIHHKFMDLDGKLYGFTPLQSLIIELDLLSNIKNVALHHFTNGGVPNKMFILKNISFGSPQYKRFRKALDDFKSLSNRFKNMVVCAEGGEITVNDLNPMNKDMEYRELAIYVTQILIMVWGIPSSRMPNLSPSKSGASGESISDAGYYRKIAHYQDDIEELLNLYLFKDMNVKWRFNRTYKQDEVREAQVDMFKTDSAFKKQNILSKYNKRLTEEKLLRILDLELDDVEDGNAAEAPNPTDRQGFLNQGKELNQTDEKMAKNKAKEKAAMNT